jgi:hypothetical protein
MAVNGLPEEFSGFIRFLPPLKLSLRYRGGGVLSAPETLRAIPAVA